MFKLSSNIQVYAALPRVYATIVRSVNQCPTAWEATFVWPQLKSIMKLSGAVVLLLTKSQQLNRESHFFFLGGGGARANLGETKTF